MQTKYIKASEAAQLWGISLHRVQELCKKGRIEGVTRFGRSWMIPANAKKPRDTRKRAARLTLDAPQTLPMPRKAPFLDMTDLYTVPGSADRVIEALSDHPEAKALFEAEIAYSRGEIDKVLEQARYFLQPPSTFSPGTAMLTALRKCWIRAKR